MLFCAPRFAHIWRVRRVITSRFHARFGFAGSQCGRGGARDQASCLATVLEVLLRAGFVASAPGTPEFCPRKDTLQFVPCGRLRSPRRANGSIGHLLFRALSDAQKVAKMRDSEAI